MTRLIQYKRSFFTDDTVKALRVLEERASQAGYTIKIDGPAPDHMNWEAVKQRPGPTGLRPEWSALPTGREIYAAFHFEKDEGPEENRKERQLAVLWGLMVPLGFMPWNRYPLSGRGDNVFHFYGQWSILLDNLLGVGRGEAAWPGFCAAAQIDVGKWEGPRATERSVQAHLHRVGFNPGVIDGIIGNKTQGALKASGLHSRTLMEVAEEVVAKFTHTPTQGENREAHLKMPDGNFSINSFGRVRTTRTVTGASLAITGTGRVVIDIFQPEP